MFLVITKTNTLIRLFWFGSSGIKQYCSSTVTAFNNTSYWDKYPDAAGKTRKIALYSTRQLDEETALFSTLCNIRTVKFP